MSWVVQLNQLPQVERSAEKLEFDGSAPFGRGELAMGGKEIATMEPVTASRVLRGVAPPIGQVRQL